MLFSTSASVVDQLLTLIRIAGGLSMFAATPPPMQRRIRAGRQAMQTSPRHGAGHLQGDWKYLRVALAVTPYLSGTD